MVDLNGATADLIAHGRLAPLPQRYTPPAELTWRHRLIARLMVWGSSDPGILAFVKRTARVKQGRKSVFRAAPSPEPGEPLSVEEAASLAGVRLGFARQLVRHAIFEEALRAEQQQKLEAKTAQAGKP